MINKLFFHITKNFVSVGYILLKIIKINFNKFFIKNLFKINFENLFNNISKN